jgi:glycine cleavage system transcriptional repressor
MDELVITAVGPDRAGLVDELTGYLLEAGANVADSRMVNLSGQFALLLLAQVPDGQGAEVVRGVTAAGGKIGLEVMVDVRPGQPVKEREGLAFRLRTFAMDRPGIVHRITHLLHGFDANIEELETHLQQKTYTSTPVFTMELSMVVPASVKVSELRGKLEELCGALNVDFELEPA